MNRYQAKAHKIMKELLNPELHPFQEQWSDAHSMTSDTLIERLATALQEAENQGIEKAVQIAMTTKYDRIEYSDEGYDMRVTSIGNKEIAEAIRALKGAS